MTLNISPTENNAEPEDAATPTDRPTLLAALLTEMTAWNPQDQARAFRHWHRGALSLIHLNVISVLEAEGPLPMTRLADELDVSDASATGIVDRLERRGFVERRHDAGDRRVVLVQVTDAGRSLFTDMEAQRRERLGVLLGELSKAELRGLLVGIRAIRAAREKLGAKHQPDSGDCPPASTRQDEA